MAIALPCFCGAILLFGRLGGSLSSLRRGRVNSLNCACTGAGAARVEVPKKNEQLVGLQQGACGV